MDEFSLIKSIRQASYRRPELQKGIGDDAAIFQVKEEQIVAAVDTFVDGIHFTKETLTAEQIGRRLLAVNLSDMAAMGATPLFYLVSIVIPKHATRSFIEKIFSGMDALAKQYKIDLIGGDTVSGKELVISLTILGSVPEGKARLRSEARAGDIVFVTGTLGDAAAGLELLLTNDQTLPEIDQQYLIKRHQEPRPQISFAKALRPLQRLALNDISDGIANELHEIAEASQVQITIDDEKLPLSPALQHYSEEKQKQFAYFGGEDFELVGTVSQADFSLIQAIGERLSIKITEIGTVSYNDKGIEKVWLKKLGKLTPLEKHGYVHKSRDNDEITNDK